MCIDFEIVLKCELSCSTQLCGQDHVLSGGVVAVFVLFLSLQSK